MVTYKAAIVNGNFKNGIKDFAVQIMEASKQHADVVLLSSEVSGLESCPHVACASDNYDELVRDASHMAKKFDLYIVMHLYEKMRCKSSEELIRSNLVFDRKGAVVANYRKPLNIQALCNATSTKMASFTTDFDVNFLILMNEDIVLQDLTSFKNMNFIVTGGSTADMMYLRGNQLIPSWAYMSNANVISDSGIFAGRTGFKTGLVIELNKIGQDKSERLSLNPVDLRDLPAEDLSQHIIRPLDLEASFQGYKEVVCHGNLCCEFYVKTREIDAKARDAHYGLAVFDGTRQMGAHYIGAQSCKILACAALYKRTCNPSPENSINVTFEKLSVRGNFTRHSAQFPVILTTETSIPTDSVVFDTKTVNDIQKVAVELSDAKNILKFGIFGRDFSKDFYEDFSMNSNNTDIKSQEISDFYEYIFNEDFIEFFDYLWIRIRVVIFIMSIYILEMM
ncbi:unnamed protein product [Parnassius apollo]|uniref:(apollo) hypothetical protein n=1 Tax=Parnassius apollo TaxID=110799 RepID=A0A8S3X5R4_PARAO|nr:unnamed protein product [Parnassius apollo]